MISKITDHTAAGEQCTTTVKTAIQSAYPLTILKDAKNQIKDDIQAPESLLKELKYFVSTSKKHFNKPAKISIIKHESKDFYGN